MGCSFDYYVRCNNCKALTSTERAVHREHLVCLGCRRGWKERTPALPRATRADPPAKCAQCRELAIPVGPDCRVPKRNDQRGWRALTLILTTTPWSFRSCCYRPGFGQFYVPNKPREVPQFLQELLAPTSRHLTLGNVWHSQLRWRN
jgi:hypothetical protein